MIVNFDWKKAVEGVCTVPEKMSVYLYSDDGTVIRGESDQTGTYSGKVAAGRYKVLTFNEGIEGVILNAVDSFGKANACAQPWIAGNKAFESDQLIREAGGWLYSASYEELTVEKQDTVQLLLTPEPRVQRVAVKVVVNGDAEKVTGVDMALTGVASSIRLCTGECTSGYNAVVPLTPKVEPVAGTSSVLYSANTLVFGVQGKASEANANTVRLDVKFDNGGSQELETVIGPEGITTPTEIEITIDIDVEVSATAAGGFTAQVTGWQVTTGDWTVDNRPAGDVAAANN